MAKMKEVREPLRVYTLTNNTKLRLHQVSGVKVDRQEHLILCQEGLVTIPRSSILFFRVGLGDEG